MASLYKLKYDHGFNTAPMTFGKAVDKLIDQAPDYYAGELETLRAKQRQMQEVLVAICDALPERYVNELLKPLMIERV